MESLFKMKFFPKPLLIVLLILFAIKLTVAITNQQAIKLWEDHDIARNLAQTGTFFIKWDEVINHTFQFPLYPFVVSLIYKVIGINPLAAVVLNLVVNLISAFMFFFICKLIAEQLTIKNENTKLRIAIVATLLFYLHPGIAMYSMFNMHPFAFNQFFFLLLLYISFNFANKLLNVKQIVLISAVAALAILDRATTFLALTPFFLYYFINKNYLQGFKYAILISTISFVLVLPWLIRNYIKDDFFGFETSAAKNLWKGSLPQSEGSNYLWNGKEAVSALSNNELKQLYLLSPKQQSDFFLLKWKNNIANNPIKSIKLYFTKLKNFWWFRANIGNEFNFNNKEIFIHLYKIYWTIVLMGVFFAIFFIPKNILPFIFTALLLSMLQAFFYTETRHRIVLEPLFIFFALVGFYKLISFRKNV